MSLTSYDLYGIQCETLEIAKAKVESLLKIFMRGHESGFHCGEYYRLYDIGQEHFVLQNNYDEFEGEWTEEIFSDFPILLYVNETDRSDDLRLVLLKDQQVFLLRHQFL